MKKIVLILACSVLCPMHILDAAKEAAAEQAPKKAAKQKRTPEKTTKPAKPATAAHAKRTKTTTHGASTTGKAPKKKKTTGTKAARAKKTTYNATETTRAKTKKAKRSHHRKGTVAHKHFDLSKIHSAQNLGTVTKAKSVKLTLGEPARGYKNAQYIQLATQAGPAQILFRTHELTAERAQRKGIEKIPHVGQRSVEIYAGNNAQGKGLARIGEFALAHGNLDVQVDVDPNGSVHVSNGNASIAQFNVQ